MSDLTITRKSLAAEVIMLRGKLAIALVYLRQIEFLLTDYALGPEHNMQRAPSLAREGREAVGKLLST